MNEAGASLEVLVLRRISQYDYAAGFPVHAPINLT